MGGSSAERSHSANMADDQLVRAESEFAACVKSFSSVNSYAEQLIALGEHSKVLVVSVPEASCVAAAGKKACPPKSVSEH